MRSAGSYRGAKKKAAREAGVPFSKFNEHYARSRVHAAVQLEQKALRATPEAARRALAVWAANGGRATAVSPPATPAAIVAMNDQGLQDHLDRNKPVDPEKAVEAAKKLTAADIDKALEATLSTWQGVGNEGPLPLSRIFAARARALGWVEDVEFSEVTDDAGHQG